MTPAPLTSRVSRRLSALAALFTLAATVLLGASVQQAAALGGDLTRAHDPSMILVGSCRYAYSTGFENDSANPLGAPLAYKSCTSDGGATGWQLLGPVWSSSPAWVHTEFGVWPKNYWAPDISVRDGVYYLYYVAPVAVGKVATGLLTSSSPEGPWADQGMIVRTLPVGDPIDPEIVTDTSGVRHLLVGGFGGTYMYSIDQTTGVTTGSPVQIAKDIENPSIAYNNGTYYLTGSKGRCCAGNSSTYFTVIGRSTNLAGPYLDQGGASMSSGGGSLWLNGTYPRIAAGGGEFYQDGSTLRHVYHYYAANAARTERLAFRDVSFLNGWPVTDVPIGESSYTLKNRNSNLCADVWSLSLADGALVKQGGCNAGTNQQWQITRTGEVYQFRAVHSSKCLEIFGASTTAGATANQFTCNGGTNQQWQRVPVFGGYSQFKNVATGQCLEVYGNSTSSGTNLNQFPCNGGANQQWIID